MAKSPKKPKLSTGKASKPELKPLDPYLADLLNPAVNRERKAAEGFAERAQASSAQFGPLAQKLQEISDRVSGIATDGSLAKRLSAIDERLATLAGKGSDTRALHTQLEAIVSRLELLKGRSIDPARMTELFDRVETAIRGSIADERFTRLEKKLDETSVPGERFDRIERRIDALATKDTTGTVPAAPAPKVGARGPLAGYSVRDVYRNAALIQGPKIGTMEVSAGDNIPGLGRIHSIRQQDGRWVVITSRGIIAQPR